MYWLVDEKVVTRGSEELNPVFPLGTVGSVFASACGDFIEHNCSR